MLTVKEIKLDGDLDWNDLINNSSTATFFQTKEWLQLWVKYWGESSEIVIYAVFDNEEIIGIAPFHIGNSITILGVPDPSVSGSLSDCGDIIIKSGREKEVWEAVLKEIKSHKSENRKLEFNYIREESPSLKILKESGEKVEEMEVSPCIDLPKTWDEYLLALSRHDRHEIRRKLRKSENENASKICDEINTDNINDFFRLMIASNAKKGDFLSGKMRDYFTEVITELGSKKLLTLCLLRYNNENIAAILILFQKNEMLLYNSGFDPKFSHLSPGLILNIYAIKQAIEEGRNRFDFLRGDEKYKFDIGGKERKLYKVTF